MLSPPTNSAITQVVLGVSSTDSLEKKVRHGAANLTSSQIASDRNYRIREVLKAVNDHFRSVPQGDSQRTRNSDKEVEYRSSLGTP